MEVLLPRLTQPIRDKTSIGIQSPDTLINLKLLCESYKDNNPNLPYLPNLFLFWLEKPLGMHFFFLLPHLTLKYQAPDQTAMCDLSDLAGLKVGGAQFFERNRSQIISLHLIPPLTLISHNQVYLHF